MLMSSQENSPVRTETYTADQLEALLNATETTEEDITEIDRQITAALSEYVVGIDDEADLVKFRGGGWDDKIDDACWGWAKRTETRDKAVSLRSMAIARWLETKALRQKFEPGEILDKHVPAIDPVGFDNFWGNVQRGLDYHLATLGVPVDPKIAEKLSDQEELLTMYTRFEIIPLTLINDRPIIKTIYYDTSGNPANIVYRVVVEPGEA